jgi:hypothetical protein
LPRTIAGLAGGPPALAPHHPLQCPLMTVWLELSNRKAAAGEAQRATTIAAPSAHSPRTAQQPVGPVATWVGESWSRGMQFPGRSSSSSSSAPASHLWSSPHVAQRFSKVSVLLYAPAPGSCTAGAGEAAGAVDCMATAAAASASTPPAQQRIPRSWSAISGSRVRPPWRYT